MGDKLSGRVIAKLAVSAAIFAIDRPYSYVVPPPMDAIIQIGMRVAVPFGPGNRRCEGLVLALETEEERQNLKCVDAILDEEPMFSSEQLQLALWMRDHFFCTLYEATRTMLPTGMWFTNSGERRVGDKTQKFITLAVSGEEAAAVAGELRMRAPHQSAALELLSSVGEMAATDLTAITGASASSLAALERKGLVTSELREVLRQPMRQSEPEPEPITLTDEQQAAFADLKERLNSGEPQAALLYGVTGSGKTSVYILLVQETLRSGRSAIVLVPEISLTPQFVSIFSRYFGDSVAVLHSSLNAGERMDEWKRIRSGDVGVVIGTRSAVFAPVEKLGLIVIDEEQEYTYKSENSPRYHARDVAKYRCVKAGALLLLGSATPSVDSMYAAKEGKYSLCTITHRYNARPLPDVLIADQREDLKHGYRGVIGSVLHDELQKNIEAGEQSILFLNRRGAASLVVCGECGYTFTCKNCSVSMTWHSVDRRLRCHYCGYSHELPEECPQCGGKLKFIGAGTQMVEEELGELFPGVGIIRMDTDTVSRIGSHRALLDKFRLENIPILLGTQMVAKGLDFENVTLTGVVSADQMLYAGNFRAGERAFSLITQVAGRSGRGEKAGRAVIQTFTPENELLLLAAKQDYWQFYEREIRLRTSISAPPVRDLITITVSAMNEAAVLRGCVRIRKLLLESCQASGDRFSILGPAPAGVLKVNNRYRYKLSLFCNNSRQLRNRVSDIIRAFYKERENKGLSVFVDAVPVE